MSSIESRIIGAIIQSLTAFIFIRTILDSRYQKDKNSLKEGIFYLILAIIILGLYTVEYNTINPIVIFLVLVFGLFFLYEINVSKAFLSAGAFMLILFLSDLLVTITMVNFWDAQDIRGVPENLVISNFLVGLFTITLIKIPILKEKIMQIVTINETKQNTETVSFIALLLSAFSIIIYMISKNYSLNKVFILDVIAIIIFIVLSIIFFKEKYEKEKVINKYDELFEYVKTFEEWMDNEKMNIHESKNQLATIRDMVKRNKKAVQYIDGIIKERINIGGRNKEKLRYIPKGGLKGLLYYKITVAENNNIKLFLDVSKNTESVLKDLSNDENKTLCRLIGIFFDNAIEAAKDSDKKFISCEVYIERENINIVISNTFSGNLEINKFSENGYTTKGKNRGKGLYLAKKITLKYNTFSLENRIINDYYVQKVIIKRT